MGGDSVLDYDVLFDGRLLEGAGDLGVILTLA